MIKDFIKSFEYAIESVTHLLEIYLNVKLLFQLHHTYNECFLNSTLRHCLVCFYNTETQILEFDLLEFRQ